MNDDELRQGLDAGDMEVNRLGDALERQAQLVDLETHVLRRWMLAAPASVQFTWRQGDKPEQTRDGNQQDPFNGVVVLNPSPYPIGLAFEAGAAQYNPLYVVPPGSFLAVPFRFINLSVALQAPGLLLGALDASQPNVTIVAARLRVPPLGIQAGPLGPLVSPGPLKGYVPGLLPGTAVAGVSFANGDLNVAGFTRLRTISRLVTGTAADLAPSMSPYDIDATIMGAGAFPSTESTPAPIVAGGVAYRFLGYDVTAFDRVRLQIFNAGAGSTTCQMSYFLR